MPLVTSLFQVRRCKIFVSGECHYFAELIHILESLGEKLDPAETQVEALSKIFVT